MSALAIHTLDIAVAGRSRCNAAAGLAVSGASAATEPHGGKRTMAGGQRPENHRRVQKVGAGGTAAVEIGM